MAELKSITSKSNANIKYIKKLSKSAKFRNTEDCFIAEGVRLCSDAIKSDAKIEKVFVSEKLRYDFEKNCDKIKTDEIYLLTDGLFEYVSETDTPQGVMFVCRKRKCKDIRTAEDIILLDRVSDPVNMGNILRTAEALGFDNIAISGDSCDVFSPKAVRGSMGAVFRLNLSIEEDICKFITSCQKVGYVCCASLLADDTETITDVDFSSAKNIIVLGNEANGIREEVARLSDKKIKIPMLGSAQSLNVASSAAILLWEVARQKIIEKKAGDKI